MKSFQTLLISLYLLILQSILFAQSANDLKIAMSLVKSGRYEEALNIYTKICDFLHILF